MRYLRWKLETTSPSTGDASEIPHNHLGCKKTLQILEYLPYQVVVWDFFHQPYHKVNYKLLILIGSDFAQSHSMYKFVKRGGLKLY